MQTQTFVMASTFQNEVVILIVIFILSLWTLIWKIFSVWTAARNGHRGWFIALLLLNTLSILDLWYLLKIAKISKERIREVFKRPVFKFFEKSVDKKIIIEQTQNI